MNYNTIVTPEQPLPCTPDEAVQIQRMLTLAEEKEPHGFHFHFELGSGTLEAEETGNWESLPERVLKLIGGLIKREGLEFLEFGVAFTAGRMAAGSHGGTAFRIYADGSIVNRAESWSDVSTSAAAMATALGPFASLMNGDGLEQIGGGTRIRPSMKVQMVKDAQSALALYRKAVT